LSSDSTLSVVRVRPRRNPRTIAETFEVRFAVTTLTVMRNPFAGSARLPIDRLLTLLVALEPSGASEASVAPRQRA